jgi:hypothetical protein
MGLVVRTIGIARARVQIGLANLAYNMRGSSGCGAAPCPREVDWPRRLHTAPQLASWRQITDGNASHERDHPVADTSAAFTPLGYLR